MITDSPRLCWKLDGPTLLDSTLRTCNNKSYSTKQHNNKIHKKPINHLNLLRHVISLFLCHHQELALKMKQPTEQWSSTAEEMGSAEEVIKAFLDYLVDPLLPLKPPSSPPLLANQQKVAKQMHAVVLLYNYYQRKRHARAEFLDFMTFCRLVVTLRPVLAAYMTSTQIPEPTDSENLEHKLSVTEKAIEDACKISTLLDVSRDIPDVNEWVVSKVAVFLVNSSKESCTLSFSSLTDGVWSIFEKSIDHCVDNQENQTTSRNLDKKKRKRRQSTGEPDLQQLAFSALKEARGIEQSHLKILEKHVTYSLDKERTSACCFIMECRSTNQEFEFSVRDTIDSLQGPLVKKISGNWTLTQLIEYYNVLPYAGIMSSWFSRQFPLICSELLNASYDFANAKVQEEVDKDVESDGTCDDENLPSSKSDKGKSGYRNGSKRENDIGLNGNLSGTRSDTEILPQRSNEESITTNVIESKKFVCPFEKEANVKSSGKNLDDNVIIVQQGSKGRVPEETCERVHSEISAVDGSLKETEKPSVKEIQPSSNLVDEEESTSANLVGEQVGTFNSFERPAKKVKSHDAAESSLPCKTRTNPLVLCDRKVLQLESSGPHVDDIQDSRGTLTNEGNSTIISLLGDAIAESKLKSEERLAKEHDLTLCKSDSRCESNSDLLCSLQDSQLKSGYTDEDNALGESNLPSEASELSATIISQSADTDDKKLNPCLATKKPSKYEKIDSALQTDVRMPITDSPSSPSGKGSDESPLSCPKGKDQILSTKSIIVYNAKRKRSRNHDAHAPTGCENAEKETAKGEKSWNTECQDKTETKVIMPFNLQGTPVADPAINPVESVHSATNHLLAVLALKETELSQTALGILLQKKHELCRQQQEIQDQIALCDESIQKILDGGGSGAIQLPRAETIFKPFPSIGSACQESDNRNANDCATVGQYMSSSNENILGGVDAGEMDLKCST